MVDLETYVGNIDKQYIKVLKFINDLYKHAQPQVPLKKILDYLGDNYSFSDLELYKKNSYGYILVKSQGFLEYGNSTKVIKSIYDCLDNEQKGISYSSADMEPFEDFYFKFSEVSKFYKFVGPNPPEIEVSNAVSKPDDIVSFLGRYQRLLINYKFLTHEQIVCLMTNQNPACINHDDEYHAHWDMVNTALDANELTPINEKEQIKAEQVKTWLASCGFIYKGFNDYLTNDANNSDQTPIEYEKRIAELEQQLAEKHEEAIEANAKILSLTVKVENAELDSIIHNHSAHELLLNDAQVKIAQLTADNNELKEQLKQQADAPADDSMLQTILDESHDYHAPDLKHAIQLWIDLYINDGIKNDSHSNKAIQWISRNTEYGENAKTSTDRIKEISSPSRYWSPHRKKEV